MKALMFEEPGKVVEGTIDDIEVGTDEILLGDLDCGICGGDIKVFKGAVPGQTFPRFARGHEFVGSVVAVGKNVKGFREGDIVARCFQNYCGWCLNCRVGRENFCLNARSIRGGGFAERVAVYAPEHRGSVFPVPDDIPRAEAALAEPITCAIGAVLKAKPQPGERFVVIGLGGMGQFVAQTLASAKAYVIGVDLDPQKLAIAKGYCNETVDASEQDVVEEVFRHTGGAGADCVMEVVGIPSTFRQALDLTRMGGRIVVVGAYVQRVDDVNVDRIFRRDLTIQAAKGPSPLVAPDGVPLAFRYIQEEIVRPRELLTAVPFDRAQSAFDGQVGGGVIKGVIVQNESYGN